MFGLMCQYEGDGQTNLINTLIVNINRRSRFRVETFLHFVV